MATRDRCLTGCGTCRARHLKCDETRPGCQVCQALCLPCPGYKPQLKWSWSSKSDEEEDTVFRRPLFTEEEQESMTRETTESLTRHTLNQALKYLDYQACNDHIDSSRSTQDRFRGPFGVLNLILNDTSSEDSPDTEPRESREPELRLPTTEGISVIQDDDYPGDPNSISSDMWNDPAELVLSDTGNTVVQSEVAVDHLQLNGTAMLCPPCGVFSSPFPSTTSRLLPKRTPELLRYFKNNATALAFHFTRGRKCPWQSIHLPSAERTYAEILLHKTASPISLSLLYSLLAASCIHLSYKNGTSIQWGRFGEAYKQIGKHQLACALSLEARGLERIKYKELLMGLLSMVILEISSRRYNDAQSLLVEAECLIRKRGLPKPHKSLKVRTLHHVYAYLRIMAESTCGCALLNICPERPISSLVSSENCFLSLRSFRVANHSTDTDLNVNARKSPEVGQNDIHLEVMGLWEESLFAEIYNIPESLMGLLSQTIRLANEEELLHRDTSAEADIFLNLGHRAKILEHYILSWKPDQSHLHLKGLESDVPLERPTDCPVYHTHCAIHQGLILFYYRRVQNLNGLMLQETVRKVLYHVRKSDELAKSRNQFGPLSLWPCFVAACEALEPELQSQLLEWLLSAGQLTSIPSFAAAADMVRMVWKRRYETKDYTVNWFDVVNQNKCPIIII